MVFATAGFLQHMNGNQPRVKKSQPKRWVGNARLSGTAVCCSLIQAKYFSGFLYGLLQIGKAIFKIRLSMLVFKFQKQREIYQVA